MIKRPPICVLVHADVNLNLIDGSTVWLQSVCSCLLRLPDVRLVIVAREPVTNRIIVDPILALGAELLDTESVLGRKSASRTPTAAEVVEAIERLDARYAPALIVVRGEAPLMALAGNRSLRHKVWAYWLKRPNLMSPGDDRDTFTVADAVGKILVQSEGTKAVFETCYGIDAQKILTLPPLVPPEAFAIREGLPSKPTGLRVVYSGKFDRDYSVEQFADLRALMALHRIDVEVHMVGDKFNALKDDPSFVSRMQNKLRSTPGLVWHGGVPRVEAMRIMASAAFGLCVRGSKYDSSLEISTKLLEFCALAVPPILNRTEIHENLLGRDYPFFASDMQGIASALAVYRRDRARYDETCMRIQDSARRYSIEQNVPRLLEAIEKAGIGRDAPVVGTPRKRRVLIAGHDLKFLNGVLPKLRAHPGLEIRIDRWAQAQRGNLEESRKHLDWAESIFCEWCAGAAVWYSQNLRPDQTCIVRLHRFEAFTPAARQVDFSKVNRLIVVSSFFRDVCVGEFGVDPTRVDILPQFVDWAEFNRPKHPWARFTLGLVGINGFFHKRFDRAVETLKALRRKDGRWRLRIRSAMPWDIEWIWNKREEVEAFNKAFAAIVSDPDLRANVIFDRPGPDMAEWFRQVGFILSTSETEGCHTSIAEGMASGAFPALLNWPGADSVYPPQFVTTSVAELVELIASLGESHLDEQARAGIAEMAKPFDVGRTQRHFEELMLDPHPENLSILTGVQWQSSSPRSVPSN